MTHCLELCSLTPSTSPSLLTTYTNLSQAYEAEFAPLTGAFPNELGLYALSTPIDAHHYGVLAYEAGLPIGFAIWHGLAEHHYELCEFYILPSHRGAGRGQALAHALFHAHAGVWIIKQLKAASLARRFWHRTLQALVNNAFTETEQIDALWGPVYQQTFSTPNYKD